MRIRTRSLPPGWYPDSASETELAVKRMLSSFKHNYTNAIAGIVPHAGWEFSGKVALSVLSALSSEIDTVVVVGGHLHRDDGVLAAFEEGYETPFGVMEADSDLLDYLKENIALHEDRYADNTVEIQIPFVKYLFPKVKFLACRAAPSEEAVKLGKVIADASNKFRKKIAVIGSTDLTHYGPNYGFMPEGRGDKAVKWVMEVNDKGFIDNLLNFKAEKALEHANRNKSACSAGGAAAALSYAAAKGSKKSVLLNHYTSNTIYPSDSFVGYAGIIYLY